jgi:hypothetical protein
MSVSVRDRVEAEIRRQLICLDSRDYFSSGRSALRSAIEQISVSDRILEYLPLEPNPRQLDVLVVIPEAIVSIEQQLGMTGLRSPFNFRQVQVRTVSSLNLPVAPYLVFSVDSGVDAVGVSPDKVTKTEFFSKRRGLTIPEGVAFWLHAASLTGGEARVRCPENIDLVAVRLRYGTDNMVPCLTVGGVLNGGSPDSGNRAYGAASCLPIIERATV